MSGMFFNATSFNQPIGNWDVSNVTNMSGMFNGALIFNQPIGNWNVGNVTNMKSMFHSALKFGQPIGNWNVSKVTNMESMFEAASLFNQPIGNWDVSNVTNMNYMFFRAQWFNQPIGNWNVSKVMTMNGLVNSTVFNQDISNWCVSNIATEPWGFSGNSPLRPQYTPKWGVCPTLSNDEFILNSEISIYPNPFATNVKISIPDNVQVKQVQVINNVGQTVYTTTTTALELAHLQTGLYYVKITTDKGVVNEKIIKN
jgi:surface protein